MTKYSATGTDHLGIRAATNLFHSVRFAAAREQPFNFAVTINWHRLGVADTEAMEMFRHLRRKVRRRWTHLRKSAAPELGTFDDAGVHENPAGRRNTHWLIRVPEFFLQNFQRDVERFLKKVTSVTDLGDALHFMPVKAAGTYAKYLAKGVSPEYARYFHLEATDQGFISGRGRSFVGRSLGFAARKRAAWKRKPLA